MTGSEPLMKDWNQTVPSLGIEVTSLNPHTRNTLRPDYTKYQLFSIYGYRSGVDWWISYIGNMRHHKIDIRVICQESKPIRIRPRKVLCFAIDDEWLVWSTGETRDRWIWTCLALWNYGSTARDLVFISWLCNCNCYSEGQRSSKCQYRGESHLGRFRLVRKTVQDLENYSNFIQMIVIANITATIEENPEIEKVESDNNRR